MFKKLIPVFLSMSFSAFALDGVLNVQSTFFIKAKAGNHLELLPGTHHHFTIDTSTDNPIFPREYYLDFSTLGHTFSTVVEYALIYDFMHPNPDFPKVLRDHQLGQEFTLKETVRTEVISREEVREEASCQGNGYCYAYDFQNKYTYGFHWNCPGSIKVLREHTTSAVVTTIDFLSPNGHGKIAEFVSRSNPSTTTKRLKDLSYCKVPGMP